VLGTDRAAVAARIPVENNLRAPDQVMAEQDSSRYFVVSVCRFVFRILAGVFDLPIDD
jgi:hypothetical protein